MPDLEKLPFDCVIEELSEHLSNMSNPIVVLLLSDGSVDPSQLS